MRVKQQERLLSKSSAVNDSYHKEYVKLKHLSHAFLTTASHQRFFWRDRYESHAADLRHHLSICPELKDAYAMLQYFYEIFHNAFSYEAKAESLDTWISVFGRSTSDGILSSVKTISDSRALILNAWKHGHSNAVCEGNNNIIQTLKDLSFGIHSFEYFRTRAMLIAGSPGVSRAMEKKSTDATEGSSFFFDEFPPLEDYVLAYDWTNPAKDFSKEG